MQATKDLPPGNLWSVHGSGSAMHEAHETKRRRNEKNNNFAIDGPNPSKEYLEGCLRQYLEERVIMIFKAVFRRMSYNDVYGSIYR